MIISCDERTTSDKSLIITICRLVWYIISSIGVVLMVEKVAIGQCRVSKGTREEIENSLRSQQTEITRFAKKKLNINEDEIEWCIEEDARSSYDESADWSYFDNAINKAKTTESIKYFI